MNARQFFDVWAECGARVGMVRESPYMEHAARPLVVSYMTERHGPDVGAAAGAYFDRLRADARTGNMKR